MPPVQAPLAGTLNSGISGGNKIIASSSFRGGLETDGCAGACQVASYNFDLVIEPVGAGATDAFRVVDIIVLAAV